MQGILKTAEIKCSISRGNVDLDIGTSIIAIISELDVKLLEFDNKVRNMEDRKRKILRKINQNKYIMNSDNYYPYGTNKKVI